MACFFYLERDVTKAQTVRLCAELTRAFPRDAWAPLARYDGFLAAHDGVAQLRIGNNNGPGWRWPEVPDNALEAWASDTATAIPVGCRYHMRIDGVGAAKRSAIKRVLGRHGFMFHRGRISAAREIRLLQRPRRRIARGHTRLL